MKVGRKCSLFLLVLMFLCVSCGRTPADGANGGGDGSGFAASQWLQGFKESTSMPAAETSFYETRRSDLKVLDIGFPAEEKREISAYAWDARYVLTSTISQGEERYFLSRQKSDLEIDEPMEIFTDWQDRPRGYAVCMDIIKEGMTVVLFAECTPNWQGEVRRYWLVTIGTEGEFLSAQSVTESYQKLEAEGYVPSLGSWWCDAEGYQYMAADGTRLAVVDANGKLLLEKECDQTLEESLTAAFHMPDGSLVFSRSIMAEGRTELLWIELPGAKEHILWEYAGVGLSQFTVTPEGVMYYTSGGVLLSWNLQTGERQRLFSFSGTGISPGVIFGVGDTCYLTVGGEHELFLHALEQKKIMALTDVVTKNEGDILCVSLIGGDYVRTCAAAFSREHAGTTIRFERRQGALPADRETEFARLSAEIAAGNAPDIMLLEYGQMEILQRLGVLEPLDDYLDQAIVDAMYAGLRDACYMDGRMYGAAFEIFASVSVTSDKIWGGEVWDLHDILDIIDSRELEGLVVLTGAVPNSSPLLSLLYLSGYYLAKSPFFDVQKGESYFESKDFIRLLEICKFYEEERNVSRQEALKLLAEGKILAVEDHFWSLNAFNGYISAQEDYDGPFHYVGCPGQSGVGVYNNTTTFVVVNRDAKDKEVIGEFLNYLLGEEAQKGVTYTPVNRKVIENEVDAYEKMIEEALKQDAQWVQEPIWEYRKFAEQYFALLDGAEFPEAPYGVHIWDIVMEEAEAYFAGTKSAEEVAKVIDNRVQLYLDERK
ncbi:MAG: extracellular solute-binding protein [Acetatifactor sp.]|nr:extracellular solute-binding protein [Acetatifactor sp.]